MATVRVASLFFFFLLLPPQSLNQVGPMAIETRKKLGLARVLTHRQHASFPRLPSLSASVREGGMAEGCGLRLRPWAVHTEY